MQPGERGAIIPPILQMRKLGGAHFTVYIDYPLSKIQECLMRLKLMLTQNQLMLPLWYDQQVEGNNLQHVENHY